MSMTFDKAQEQQQRDRKTKYQKHIWSQRKYMVLDWWEQCGGSLDSLSTASGLFSFTHDLSPGLGGKGKKMKSNQITSERIRLPSKRAIVKTGVTVFTTYYS